MQLADTASIEEFEGKPVREVFRETADMLKGKERSLKKSLLEGLKNMLNQAKKALRENKRQAVCQLCASIQAAIAQAVQALAITIENHCKKSAEVAIIARKKNVPQSPIRKSRRNMAYAIKRVNRAGRR